MVKNAWPKLRKIYGNLCNESSSKVKISILFIYDTLRTRFTKQYDGLDSKTQRFVRNIANYT